MFQLKICLIEGCGRKHRASGLCHNHYNLQHARDRLIQNPSLRRIYSAKWRKQNPESQRKARNKYLTKRRATDKEFLILEKLRGRIWAALKSKQVRRSIKTADLLGCTLAEFIRHLESKWLPGMTWQNYGNKDGMWQIDHIIPCSIFNLIDESQQHACFHFSNQRPLWKRENCVKSNKIQIPT